jgi:CubicO group peptidase (beta-lactamase class C family)
MRIRAHFAAMLTALLGSALLLAGSTTAAPGPLRTPTVLAEPTPAKPAAATAHSLDAADVNAWLDGYMPYALQSGDVAGAVVVVVKDGKVLTQRGYGHADVATGAPVDPEATMFRPGSVSKLYTWTAVMQQVEAGKLNLDADVNTYLDFKIPPRDGKPITLRDLMTHTAGFEETIKHLLTADPKRLHRLGDILKLWTPDRIYAPGAVPAYSNYGAALAGYIVERVSGEPFDVYVDRHIFQPLGMAHSTFTQPLPARFQAQMAKGYPRASQPAKPYELINAAPAGSLAGTGSDMGRFMIAHLQDGRYGSVQILRPETARLMHAMADQPTPPFPGMALGFYRDDLNGHLVIAHGGDTQVFHSDLHLFLNDGVGLYISMNSTGKEGAAQTVRALLAQQFADRYFPAPATAALPTASTAKHDAAIMAGTYWASRRSTSSWIQLFYLPGQMTVAALPDGAIQASGIKTASGAVRKWREVGPFLWQEVGGKALLKAVLKDGKVAHFTYDELPAIEVFQPVPAAYNASLNSLAFALAFAILLMTVVLWPISILVRRRYGQRFTLSGRPALLYRLVRVSALVDLITAAGWLTALTMVGSNLGLLDDPLDGWLRLLQLGSLLGVVGAGVALFNLVVVWGDRARSWWAKTSSVLIALACLIMVWFVFLLHMLSPSLNY